MEIQKIPGVEKIQKFKTNLKKNYEFDLKKFVKFMESRNSRN